MNEVKESLKELTGHSFIRLTSRGNNAIEEVLRIIKGKLLIPEEGGWLSYKKLPVKLGIELEEVKCDDAKISIPDLKEKLQTNQFGALLYQNPGGYFADQPIKEIFELCNKHQCLVILDVTGAIGMGSCDGNYADLMVCSFGRWKPVNAGKGGFISTNNQELFNRFSFGEFDDTEVLKVINEKLEELPDRITFLKSRRDQIITDLRNFEIVPASKDALVVVVTSEKEKVIKYCTSNNLEWTECPRYIRINKMAICIEVKRL